MMRLAPPGSPAPTMRCGATSLWENFLYLLDHLAKSAILDAYAKAAGQELDGKALSPESSSALVANAFGYFLDRPGELPPLPNLSSAGWPAESVQLEANVRFPWAGGRHPWLDVLVETGTHTIGIESKRYEPYRGRHEPSFSDAYDRDVWSPSMKPFLDVMSKLRAGRLDLHALDATQLVKHALALSTQCGKSGKQPVLYYLYADPSAWPDGRQVANEDRLRHHDHLKAFEAEVAGAHVQFVAGTYPELLAAWRQAAHPLQQHAEAVSTYFSVAPLRSSK